MKRIVKQAAFYALFFLLVFALVMGGLIGLDRKFGRYDKWPKVCDANGACAWVTTTPLPTPGPATVEAIETLTVSVWATNAAATAVVVEALP